jgi:hypothetical protein
MKRLIAISAIIAVSVSVASNVIARSTSQPAAEQVVMAPPFRDGAEPAHTLDELQSYPGVGARDGDTATVVDRAVRRHRPHGPSHYSVKLQDLTPSLRDKIAEILHVCHTHIVSGYRPGARIAGSGHASLHSAYPSRAADVAGDYNCIYAQLHGWKGGYSTDYKQVAHVHISYSPPGSGYLAGHEWHARFRHYGSGGHRYALRHRRHVLMAHRS